MLIHTVPSLFAGLKGDRLYEQLWGQIMTLANGKWTAVVLAGQRPGPDTLASHFGITYKALLPVGGVPMVARVVSTLAAAPSVGRIVILTQAPDAIAPALPDGVSVDFAESGAGISTSILGLAGTDFVGIAAIGGHLHRESAALGANRPELSANVPRGRTPPREQFLGLLGTRRGGEIEVMYGQAKKGIANWSAHECQFMPGICENGS